MRIKDRCETDDARKKKKKSSLKNFQNPDFHPKDVKIATEPQRQASFEDVRLLFLPRLSGGWEPCSYMKLLLIVH